MSPERYLSLHCRRSTITDHAPKHMAGLAARPSGENGLYADECMIGVHSPGKDLIHMPATPEQPDDSVRREPTCIASERGIPVRPETAKSVFDMSSDEFEAACQSAVARRNDVKPISCVTRLDRESGMILKVNADGREEYVAV